MITSINEFRKVFELCEGDMEDMLSIVRHIAPGFETLHYGFDYIEIKLKEYYKSDDYEKCIKLQDEISKELHTKFDKEISEIYTEETGWFKIYLRHTKDKNISESAILKQLEKDNKYTLPKIPTQKVFFHPVPDIEVLSVIRKDADKEIYDYRNQPLETVGVHDIVPTQRSLRISNLESTEQVGNDTDAYLVKDHHLYYILDGHHRIANCILRKDKTIKAHVYTNK